MSQFLICYVIAEEASKIQWNFLTKKIYSSELEIGSVISTVGIWKRKDYESDWPQNKAEIPVQILSKRQMSSQWKL